jgi:hypothetical protein
MQAYMGCHLGRSTPNTITAQHPVEVISIWVGQLMHCRAMSHVINQLVGVPFPRSLLGNMRPGDTQAHSAGHARRRHEDVQQRDPHPEATRRRPPRQGRAAAGPPDSCLSAGGSTHKLSAYLSHPCRCGVCPQLPLLVCEPAQRAVFLAEFPEM